MFQPLICSQLKEMLPIKMVKYELKAKCISIQMIVVKCYKFKLLFQLLICTQLKTLTQERTNCILFFFLFS